MEKGYGTPRRYETIPVQYWLNSKLCHTIYHFGSTALDTAMILYERSRPLSCRPSMAIAGWDSYHTEHIRRHVSIGTALTRSYGPRFVRDLNLLQELRRCDHSYNRMEYQSRDYLENAVGRVVPTE